LQDVRPQRLLIVSHVVHFEDHGNLFAYEPYAREIDVWASIFREVVIAAPGRRGPPDATSARLSAANIRLAPQKEAGGTSLISKLVLIASIPSMVWKLVSQMRKADAIHIRCPGNLGLIGALLAPLFGKPMVAKYAGQWSDYPGEARTVRFQKRVLGSGWWRGPVTIYEEPGPSGSRNLIPFFNSVFDGEQLERARRSSGQQRPRSDGPLHVLFVGRLSESKNVDVVVDAAIELRGRGTDFELDVLGEGELTDRLASRISATDQEEHVRLHGAVPFDEVLAHYETADVLVLISETEGWPKAICEGMAFGLICVGSNRGAIPRMLGEDRGFVIDAGDQAALVDILARVSADPEGLRGMSERASLWAQEYSLEALRTELVALLHRAWDE
jgi:glycosyltransferase involved in cell wall biosynthesis